jgi:hypothetical protein
MRVYETADGGFYLAVRASGAVEKLTSVAGLDGTGGVTVAELVSEGSRLDLDGAPECARDRQASLHPIP